MSKKFRVLRFLSILIGMLLLAACQQPEPAPPKETAPTATAVAVPTEAVVEPTAEPEPTATSPTATCSLVPCDEIYLEPGDVVQLKPDAEENGIDMPIFFESKLDRTITFNWAPVREVILRLRFRNHQIQSEVLYINIGEGSPTQVYDPRTFAQTMNLTVDYDEASIEEQAIRYTSQFFGMRNANSATQAKMLFIAWENPTKGDDSAAVYFDACPAECQTVVDFEEFQQYQELLGEHDWVLNYEGEVGGPWGRCEGCISIIPHEPSLVSPEFNALGTTVSLRTENTDQTFEFDWHIFQEAVLSAPGNVELDVLEITICPEGETCGDYFASRPETGRMVVTFSYNSSDLLIEEQLKIVAWWIGTNGQGGGHPEDFGPHLWNVIRQVDSHR